MQLLAVQVVTLARLVAALVFATIAFQNVAHWVLIGIYGSAMISDLIDGGLAERLHARTFFGKILDLVSDKSLTIVSLLYAAARGISLTPLALLAAREIAVLGLRLIVVDGNQLLPTNRLFGGATALLTWGSTAALILAAGGTSAFSTLNKLYWFAAIVVTVNLALRIHASRERITASLTEGE